MPQTDSIPQAFRAEALATAEALRGIDRVVVAAHVNPDGDAAGSLAAAGHILKALGKEHVLVSTTGLPQYLAFFPMPSAVHESTGHLPFTPAAALLLDCGEPYRLGDETAALVRDLPSVNIDHHVGEGMGTLANWVVPAAAATAQLMAYAAMAFDLPLSGGLGDSVALGLIADTGGFSHGNTTAEVFALCAALSAGGCSIHDLREKLDNCWTCGHMRLWGRLMQRVEVVRDGTVAWCPVSLRDLRECQARKEDLEGFVEVMRRLSGVRASVLVREDAPGCCKFSLRSTGAVDVRAAAAALGGGGHRNAAGGTVKLLLSDACDTVLAAVDDRLTAEERAETDV